MPSASTRRTMQRKLNKIALMGSIFSSAVTVYVWLADGDGATDRAMEYLGIAGFLEYFTTGRSSRWHAF